MNPRRRDWWLVTAWLGSLAIVRAGSIDERDPYWQIRAGVETLHGLPVVRPDTWSWDPVAEPFLQTSPGWNVLLGLAWEGIGWAGLFLVSLASIGSYFLVAVLLARRLGARPLPTLAGVLACSSLALSMISPRATLAAQTLFLAGILTADAWRGRRRPHPAVDAAAVLAAAGTLSWAGAWLHMSWLAFAPATALCWAVLWFLTPGLSRARAAVLSAAGLAGALLGLALGPYGAEAWEYSQRVRDSSSALVIEWLGVLTPGLALRWVPAALLGLLVSGAALVWVVRRWRAGTIDQRTGLVAVLSVVGLPAALASVSAIRFVGVSLLTVAPVAAMGATWLWDRVRARAAERPPRGIFRSARVRFWSDGRRWRTVLTLVLVVLAPGVLLMALPLSRPLPELAVMDELPRGCRLFSDPSTAGPVLLLRPDVTVWIDGRFDYWGPDRVAAATAALASSDVDVAPLPRATCVMLSSENPVAGDALAGALDRSAVWRRAVPSGGVRVWVRK